MTSDRFFRFQNEMHRSGSQAIAINAGSYLKYLTGLDFHLSERPVILLIPDQDKPALFFPEFEREKAESSNFEMDLVSYGEDPGSWMEVLRKPIQTLGFHKRIIGVPPESMRFLELELLQQAAGHQKFESCADLLKELLSIKDTGEIESIKEAVVIAEKAMEALLKEPVSGVTESAIANKLVIKLLENGSEPDLPFNPIVASGPNSANPHAVPGERVIRDGDLVVIDWGARAGGYISDITRTFQVGRLDDRFQEIANIVLEANQSARSAVKPGMQACDLDDIARKIISDAGYGKYFTHRTGHGIGMQAHEEPYISEVSTTKLAAGMMFTIEPGIYLPGEGGVRIEDNVLVTPDDSATLTSLPHEIRTIE